MMPGTFEEFLEFVRWMWEEHNKHANSKGEKKISFNKYKNERFHTLVKLFNERVLH